MNGNFSEDFKTPKAWCPSCHQRLDDDEAEGPGPGDFSVCLCCSSLLRFTDEMKLRMIEEKDLDDMDDELRAKVAKIIIACKSIEPRMKERIRKRAEDN